MQRTIVIVSFLLILIIGAALSMFTVYQTESAMVYMFKLQKDPATNKARIYEPGLHFRVPIIANVLKYDMRERLLDIKTSRITTKEKKDVIVDFYILWRIDDLELFYNRTVLSSVGSAEEFLEQKVVSVMKAEIGRRDISELVSEERLELMEKLRVTADTSAHEMGVSIADVRIKRIDLPDNVSNSVFARMRAERNQDASEIRALGNAEAIKIRANADRTERVLLAEANREDKNIRGNGDAKAAQIYAKAYSKAPEFFDFYRSMEAYKESFADKSDMLVLAPKGEFFHYLDSSK